MGLVFTSFKLGTGTASEAASEVSRLCKQQLQRCKMRSRPQEQNETGEPLGNTPSIRLCQKYCLRLIYI